MVVCNHPALSLSRQCRLLSIGRSSLYYKPKGESEETLALMGRIDGLFLKYPVYGARQMVRHLRRGGVRIGRLRNSTHNLRRRLHILNLRDQFVRGCDEAQELLDHQVAVVDPELRMHG